MPHQVRVTLYTRPGCHLCADAKEEMLKAQCGDAFTLEEVDIETDPQFLQRFGMDIPVVSIDGVVTFKHRVNAAEFRRQIERAERAAGD